MLPPYTHATMWCLQILSTILCFPVTWQTVEAGVVRQVCLLLEKAGPNISSGPKAGQAN